MIQNTILSIAAAVVLAEFAGYWLHMLLHSDKIRFLSRNHMLHHLSLYPPNKPMRPSREYLQSTYARANIIGLGMEWILPVALILSAALAGLRLLGVGAALQGVFAAASLSWGYLMFSYMHDAMHLRDFWMEKNPILSRWFLRARKRHDIHHMLLDDSGRSRKNFGICFFLLDWIFGSLAREHRPFNKAGLNAAMRRYAFIFEETPQPSGRG